jgi:hypothetical protein
MTAKGAQRDSELGMLSFSFKEELEKIRLMLDDFSFTDDDEEESERGDEKGGEEKEYSENYGDIKKEMKKYHERLKAYEKTIKEGIETYADNAAKDAKTTERNESTKNELDMKNPWERGHKLGCGCPGCTAYRDFYGIRLESTTHASWEISAKTNGSKRTEKYEESGQRPCGGRMFNHFHGERVDLKNVLGNYTRRFNFGMAGY